MAKEQWQQISYLLRLRFGAQHCVSTVTLVDVRYQGDEHHFANLNQLFNFLETLNEHLDPSCHRTMDPQKANPNSMEE